jgi:hypothetical protein
MSLPVTPTGGNSSVSTNVYHTASIQTSPDRERSLKRVLSNPALRSHTDSSTLQTSVTAFGPGEQSTANGRGSTAGTHHSATQNGTNNANAGVSLSLPPNLNGLSLLSPPNGTRNNTENTITIRGSRWTIGYQVELAFKSEDTSVYETVYDVVDKMMAVCLDWQGGRGRYCTGKLMHFLSLQRQTTCGDSIIKN